MRRLALLVLATISLHSQAIADLTWESREIEAPAPPPGGEKILSFAFKNTGLAPVHIESVQVSCGCLSTQLSKTRVAPGERGTLSTRLRTVGISLPKLIRIQICTAEDPIHPTRLQIRLRTPATLEPAFLSWESVENTKKKSARLTLPEGWTARLSAPTKSAPFVASLERDTLSNVWALRVTPNPGASAGDYELPVECYSGLATTPAETRTLFLRLIAEPSPQESRPNSPEGLGK